jgi:hypothetical protein
MEEMIGDRREEMRMSKSDESREKGDEKNNRRR